MKIVTKSREVRLGSRIYRTTGSEWTLVKEPEGYIFRHRTGAGHSGHHPTPEAALDMAQLVMPCHVFLQDDTIMAMS